MCINNDLVIHRQVKTSDIISRRFGDFMTPLSRVQMRLKLTNARSRVTTDLHSRGGYTNTLAQVESVCMFKLSVNNLFQIRLSCQRDALHQTINTEFVARFSTAFLDRNTENVFYFLNNTYFLFLKKLCGIGGRVRYENLVLSNELIRV